MHTKIGSSHPTSRHNTWMIIGSVTIVVVVIVTILLVVNYVRYRQILQRKNTDDTGNIENAVYEGDTQPDRELPKILHTDGDYEQPAQYAQLVSSKRVPIDENYQSLIVQS